MSMYECKNCGDDHSTFPGVFMAVNTTDPVYPYHRTEFEERWNTYSVDAPLDWRWKEFWNWLGENKIMWFCSLRCADNYMYRLRVEQDTEFTKEADD